MKISTKLIPRDVTINQAFSFVKVIENNPKQRAPSFTNKTPTHVRNSRHILELLGFIDTKGCLTPSGSALLSLPDIPSRKARFALAFEEMYCVQQWISWAGVTGILALNSKSAGQFLNQRSNLGTNKNKLHRAKILQRWLIHLRKHHPLNPKQFELVKGKRHEVIKIKEFPIFENNKSSVVLSDLGKGSDFIRAATGYFSWSGYDCLARPLHESRIHLMIGAEDSLGRSQLENPLEVYRASIENGLPSVKKRIALNKLYLELIRGTSRVRIFRPKHHHDLHAKVYIFDERAYYITSSNLTFLGLHRNIEAGDIGTKESKIKYLVSRFDEYFEESEEIISELIEPLEEGMAPPVEPGLLYLRVLMELFGKLKDLSDITEYKLAAYQKMIVGTALNYLQSQKGAIIISPTGTGKTVMGAYIAASLFHTKVRRVIVLPPDPSVGEEWVRVLNNFQISCQVITHGIVREQGSQDKLEELLSLGSSTDLFIIDECHSFRTEGRKGVRNLHKLFQSESKNDGPYRILLTATPISTGIENLNTQISFVNPNEKLEKVQEIADSDSIVNVSLPLIAEKFGELTKEGNRAIMFSDHTRYFADRTIRTVEYDSPNFKIFSLIENLDLRRRITIKARQDDRQRTIPGYEDSSPFLPGGQNTLVKLVLANRAESNHLSLLETINRMKKKIENDEHKYYDPERILVDLSAIILEVSKIQVDSKIKKLFSILDDTVESNKILLFSKYKSTVQYLFQKIEERYPSYNVRILTGETKKNEKKRILELFAPVAHHKPNRRLKESIDILIATDCISEGQNLQDATVLVNYDLHWTPLRIIQRVGRLDRPTILPRHFYVYNFYPGDNLYDQLVNLWERLEGRDQLYEEFSKTKIIGDVDRDMGNIEKTDLGYIRALYEKEDYNSILKEYFPTSNHLLDFARAKDEDIKRAEKLPIGSRSSKSGNESGIYVLFEFFGEKYSLWRPRGNKDVEIAVAPNKVSHESLLPMIRTRMNESLQNLPSEIDDWIGTIIHSWAKAVGIDEQEIKILFSMFVD